MIVIDLQQPVQADRSRPALAPVVPTKGEGVIDIDPIARKMIPRGDLIRHKIKVDILNTTNL